MKKLQSVGLTILCVTLLALLCGANRAWAQDVTATITGTVTDPSGATVVGATVTVKSVERGVTYTAASNEAGLYRVSQLPVGNYELRVEKEGFQTSVYPAFTLVLNQVARIDVALKVGQVTQTVEVTGAVPVLKTESTQVDTIINSSTNDNLPLASRNYVQLTLLAPGSVSTDPSSFNTASKPTISCSMAWITTKSPITCWATPPPRTPLKNSTSLPIMPRRSSAVSWAALSTLRSSLVRTASTAMFGSFFGTTS
jgi:hypothetical protein